MAYDLKKNILEKAGFLTEHIGYVTSIEAKAQAAKAVESLANAYYLLNLAEEKRIRNTLCLKEAVNNEQHRRR